MNISSNISSLQANQSFMNANANNVANVNTDKFIPTDTRIHENGENSVQATFRKADDTGSERSQTDLTKEIPDQMNIENIAEANLAAVRTEDEMFGTLLDIKA